MVISLLPVVSVALFPFDFFVIEVLQNSFSQDLLANFSKAEHFDLETVINLFSFVPYGYIFACLYKPLTSSTRNFLLRLVGSAVGIGLVLEGLQSFLPSRTPSGIDVLLYILGAIGGSMLYLANPRFVPRQTEKLQTSLRMEPLPWKLFILLVSYLLIALLLVGALQRLTLYVWSPVNWDPSFPLILGNEQTSDRPWKGSIRFVCFATAPDITPAGQIMSAPPQSGCDSSSEQSVMGWYDLGQSLPIGDKTGLLPALISGEMAQGTVAFSDTSWLQTNGNVSALTAAVQQTRTLKLVSAFTTAKQYQTGPGRVISISQDILTRNLTLGQTGENLVLRLRTPITGANGSRLEFIGNSFFQQNVLQNIVFSFDSSGVELISNSGERHYRFAFTPGATLFWLLSPLNRSAIHWSRLNTFFYNFLLYSLLWLPWGVLLTNLLLKLLNFRSIYLWISLASAIVLSVYLVENVLAFAASSHLQVSTFLLSAGTCALWSSLILFRIQASKLRGHQL
jgi:VanZ family protein